MYIFGSIIHRHVVKVETTAHVFIVSSVCVDAIAFSEILVLLVLVKFHLNCRMILRLHEFAFAILIEIYRTQMLLSVFKLFWCSRTPCLQLLCRCKFIGSAQIVVCCVVAVGRYCLIPVVKRCCVFVESDDALAVLILNIINSHVFWRLTDIIHELFIRAFTAGLYEFIINTALVVVICIEKFNKLLI